MKKTSLYLEEHLDEALARRAAEEGLTKAELIRRTLSGAVARPPRPMPTSIGIITGAPETDIASDVDTFLAETGFGA